MQLPYDFIPPTHLSGGMLKIEPNTYFICTANKMIQHSQLVIKFMTVQSLLTLMTGMNHLRLEVM